MSGMEAVVLSIVLGSSQVLGLAIALSTRLSEGSRLQGVFQTLFLFYLALIGGATIVSVAVARDVWLGFGVTLSVMLVTAVSDFRQPCRAEV